MSCKIRIIDGANQFLIAYAKATSYPDLLRRMQMLNFGCDYVYWTFDGYDSRFQRREIYPEYKNTKSRTKNKQDMTKYDLLRQFKSLDLPEMGGISIIEIPQVEADDVIRTLVKLLTQNQSGFCDIEVVSNDADLLDMTAITGVTQPQGTMPKGCIKPSEIPLYKTLVGDNGDNIKGLKGFGDKAWEKLTDSEKAWIQHCLDQEFDQFEEPGRGQEFDGKLAAKLLKDWQEVKMWFQVVSPIWVDHKILSKHTANHPKKVLAAKVLTMD